MSFQKMKNSGKNGLKPLGEIQIRTNFSIGNLQRVMLCVKYTSKNPTTYQKQHVVSLVYFYIISLICLTKTCIIN